jgi:hypothetical protein
MDDDDLGCGRYAVSASLMVGDKVQKRRIECSNPAFGAAARRSWRSS